MGSPEQFHSDAHPKAREITGNLSYGEWGQCIAQSKQNDRRCHGHARGPHGKCNTHGGSDDSGAPEDNTNAIRHAMFAERDRFYRKVMDNLDRHLCDDIYRDYVEQYRGVCGEPTTGDLDTMWSISVEHIQISHADNWLADRPESLNSGNALVDQETRYTSEGQQYHRYKEAVTVATKLKLRKEHRQWLKDKGMMNDPESAKADAISDLKDAWKKSAQGGDPS